MQSLINDLITGYLEDKAPLPRSPAHDERLAVGAQLGGYLIQRWIGSGSTGDVYQAEHARLGHTVAIKRLRSDLAVNRKALQRFFDEARAVNRICHENIVEITDLTSSDGHVYCVMEYLDGTTLAALEYRSGMRLDRALDIAIQICDALFAAHAAEVIHRDLKPQNVMLVWRGGRQDFVKLLDFGVAKLRGAERRLSTDSTGNVALGTPGYMAPEQLLGGNVDLRVDIYALGVMLYQMATGLNPFVADTWGQAVVRHATEVPARPSALPGAARKLPPELESLILRCLEKTPEKRPRDTAEIAAALRQLRIGGRAVNRRRRRTLPIVAALLLLPGGLAALALGSSLLHETPSGVTRPVTPTAAQPIAEHIVRPGLVSRKAALDRDETRRPRRQPSEAGSRDPVEPGSEQGIDPGSGADASAEQWTTASGRPTAAPEQPAAAQGPTPYEDGRRLLRAGKAVLALGRLEAAVAADPEDAQAHLLLGKAHAMLGRQARAIAAFERFVALAPERRDAIKLRRIIADYHQRTASPRQDGMRP